MQPDTNGSRQKNFLSVKEAAAYVGVSLNTFYLWTKKSPKKGGPPVRRFGTILRLPRDQFIKWANGETEN